MRSQTPPALSALAADPRLNAVPFLERSRGRALSLLGPGETAQLAAMGQSVAFARGEFLYRADGPADWLFDLVQGAVKTARTRPGGATLVTRFLFPGDFCGLAEQGRYVESAEAIVPSVAWRIPMEAFARLVETNGALALRVICRLAHDLRETQRQMRILARNDAPGRVAMFLELLARAELVHGPGGTFHLPMSRSDIADFVGLTIEAVSRALSRLDRFGIVTFVDRHHYHVLDRARLQSVAEGAALGEVAPKRARRGAKAGRSTAP